MGVLDYIRHGSKGKCMSGDAPLREIFKGRWVRGTVPHWIAHNKRCPYILRAVLSVPPWVKRADFEALEIERDRLSRLRGEPYELDHIIPLSGPRVSGLTVPWNMKPIPRAQNGLKGNGWCQWHGELFPTELEPHQRSML